MLSFKVASCRSRRMGVRVSLHPVSSASCAVFVALWCVGGEMSEVLLMHVFVIFRNIFPVRSYF